MYLISLFYTVIFPVLFAHAPSETPNKGIILWTRGTLPFQLQAYIQYELLFARYLPALVASRLTLQCPTENFMYRTVARYTCVTRRPFMQLLKRRNEELVRILLCVSCKFRGWSPCYGKKARRSICRQFARVHLHWCNDENSVSFNKRNKQPTSVKSLSISHPMQSEFLHVLLLCLSLRK